MATLIFIMMIILTVYQVRIYKFLSGTTIKKAIPKKKVVATVQDNNNLDFEEVETE